MKNSIKVTYVIFNINKFNNKFKQLIVKILCFSTIITDLKVKGS